MKEKDAIIRRNLTRRNGVRTQISLDKETWDVIDKLAARQGLKWGDLARHWIMLAEMDETKSTNMTRVIRSGLARDVVEFIDDAITVQDTEGDFPVEWLSMFDDDTLKDELKGAEKHIAHQDFGGFRIHICERDGGKLVFYIENGLKDAPNGAISTPFGLHEWQSKWDEC